MGKAYGYLIHHKKHEPISLGKLCLTFHGGAPSGCAIAAHDPMNIDDGRVGCRVREVAVAAPACVRSSARPARPAAGANRASGDPMRGPGLIEGCRASALQAGREMGGVADGGGRRWIAGVKPFK
jgi:hypothetical protein